MGKLRVFIYLSLAAIVVVTMFLATFKSNASSSEHWVKVPKNFRGQLLAEVNFVGPQNERQRAVVAAFEHAWKGYRQYAWGHDTLKPNSMQPDDWFGLGVTIVDSLSTMIIMNLTEHVAEAKNWLETSFRDDIDRSVNLFEVTIRVLGGLVSAYHLSGGEKVYLAKASDIAQRLIICFTSSHSGIPYPWINLRALEVGYTSVISIAAAGSVEMEFRALTYSTGDTEYEQVANKTNSVLHTIPKIDGLAYADVSVEEAMFPKAHEGKLTAGGRVDSYYEYLLKQWIQMGKPANHTLIQDYQSAVDGMVKHLVRPTVANKYTIIGQSIKGEFIPKVEHLACFLPGTLLLGYQNGMPKSHFELANKLLESCHATYTHNPTHLAGDETMFTDEIKVVKDSNYNILRPEFIESLYYFWVFTGNSTYQQWGWDIFMAIEKYAKVEHGYTSLENVDSTNPTSMDHMESFFLAETLKYFYLLFSDDRNLVDLNRFVFNTEAHPLPILRKVY